MTTDLLIIKNEELKKKINVLITELISGISNFIALSYLSGKSESDSEHRQKLIEYTKFLLPGINDEEIEQFLTIENITGIITNGVLEKVIKLIMLSAQNSEDIKVIADLSREIEDYLELLLDQTEGVEMTDEEKIDLLEKLKYSNKVASA